MMCDTETWIDQVERAAAISAAQDSTYKLENEQTGK
jgi:hypothetical protein